MAKPSHVVVIMSDQHHAGILGAAGDAIAQTPHLDALARDGARFTNAYCPFPLCGPSRMSFMTSQYPADLQLWDNHAALSSNAPTFAHGAAAAGYETVLSGRMHFVGLDQRHGFQHRLIGDVPKSAHLRAGWQLREVLGCLIGTPGYGLMGVRKSGPGRSGYLAYDEAVTEATVQWLRQRATRADAPPFLLVVGYVMPHCPFVAHQADFAAAARRLTYADLPPPDPHLHPLQAAMRRAVRIDPPPSLEDQWRTRAAYYGMVAHLDRQVGRVLGALAAAGLADDTLVVYTSDHGEALGEHGLWWKSTFYDGSSRVPLLLRWPGRLPAGQVVSQNVGLVDIGPTVLDCIGAPALPAARGRSLRALANGDATGWSDTVLMENVPITAPAPGQPAGPSRSVRQGPWKYNYYHGYAPELFHLGDDPDERTNRAADPTCAEVVARLHAAVLADWDPAAIDRHLARQRAEQALIRPTLQRHPLPEPDPVWYGTTPPDNFFDPVPYAAYHPEA
jgi:choline-sulfatase